MQVTISRSCYVLPLAPGVTLTSFRELEQNFRTQREAWSSNRKRLSHRLRLRSSKQTKQLVVKNLIAFVLPRGEKAAEAFVGLKQLPQNPTVAGLLVCR